MADLRKWILPLVVLVGFAGVQVADAANGEEACWESCSRSYLTENYRYKEVYDNVMKTAFEINRLYNIYNVTRIGWLIDTAVSNEHDMNENRFTSELESGRNIYNFELLLALALVGMVNAQANYFVQYDESAAWACNELSCVTSYCSIPGAINKLSQVEMLPTSHCPGLVEAACSLLNDRVNSLASCSASNSNTMVVAITNGNFYINDPDRHEKFTRRPDHKCPPLRHADGGHHKSDFLYSQCHSHFPTRFVIGTNNPSSDVMEIFPSKHGNYRYIHDEIFSYNALVELVNCMYSTNCCSSVTTPTVATCFKTQGSFGDLITSFPTYQGISSSYYWSPSGSTFLPLSTI